MPLGKEDPHQRGGERGRYSTIIGSSNMKIIADRHRHAAYHNKHWQLLFMNVNIDDLE